MIACDSLTSPNSPHPIALYISTPRCQSVHPAAQLPIPLQWRRYWDVSKPILVEKSPRHALMTRLLQHWFTPERSFFVVMLRHPLATMKHIWERQDLVTSSRFAEDCGETALQHWLLVHAILLDDLRALRNVAVVQYERFAMGDTQGQRWYNWWWTDWCRVC